MDEIKKDCLALGQKLGIKFNKMTIYRAELLNLKNDGLKLKQIAELLGESGVTNLQNWYTKGYQPKDHIIEKLENMFFIRCQREHHKVLNKLMNPV